MNRLIKQQMRIFNVLIPSEKKQQRKVAFQAYYLTYGKVEKKRLVVDEAFLDIADMIRRLGLDELDVNTETSKIMPDPQKVSNIITSLMYIESCIRSVNVLLIRVIV